MYPRAPFLDLFVIYINDFLQASQIFNFISYADDTTLLSTMSNFTNSHNDDADILINEELYKTNEWQDINKLSLNDIKSKFMIIHMPKKFKTPVPKINNIMITKVDDFYFLRLILDTQLKNTLKIYQTNVLE